MMKEWAGIRSAEKTRRKWLEDGFVHTPKTLQPIARAVLDALDRDDVPPKDVELQGALLALVAPKVHYKDYPRHEMITAFHVALGGIAFALEAVVEATRYQHAVASWIGNYTQEFA